MAAAVLSLVLLVSSVSGSHIRYSRDSSGASTDSQGIPGASTGSRGIPGASTGSQGIAGASSGSRGNPGASSGSQGIHGASSGSQGIHGASSGSQSIAGASSGSRGNPGASSGSQGFPGASSGSQGFPGAFSGSQGFPGASSGTQGFHGASSGSQGFPGASSGSGGSFSGASSSSFSSSSSSGTKVNPGPGGYGNFNAFAGTSNFGNPPSFPGSVDSVYRGGAGNQIGQQMPFGNPGFNPFVPQYGQAYPYTPFPTYAAPFDFVSFLNQYFQSLQNFQAQAEAQAQQAAASGGYSPDNNEVGGMSMVSYGPQGGYGSANVFPKPEGGLESRFGGDNESPQNSVGPVGSVSTRFGPPSGGGFGVFSSSSSGSSDVNGKKTSFKQSTYGVNDNGKVTTYTAHDP